MLRVFIIVVLSTATQLLAGQGFGDMAMLAGNFDEQRYAIFLRAAREDRDSTKVIMLMGLYGNYLVHQQRYQKAEDVLFAALSILKKMEPSLRPSIKFNRSSIYDTYDYLGEYFTQTGDYKKAVYFLQMSEAARAEHFSRGSPYRIINLQTLADFYLETQQTRMAEACLQKLIRELNHTRFNNEMLKAAYGTYFNGMTEVCLREGRLSESRVFFKKLVKFQSLPFTSFRAAMRNRSVTNVRTLYLQSRLSLLEGKAGDAVSAVDRALRHGPDSLDYLPLLLHVKTIGLFSQKRLKDALTVAEQLLQVHLRNIQNFFYTLNEQEKETLFNRVKDHFDLYNSLVIQAASDNALDSGYLESLINFRLQTKALLLNDAIKIRQAIFASHDSSLIHNYQTLSLLRNKASQTAYRKSSRRQMSQYDDEIKVLEKKISRKVAKLHQAERELTFGDVQQQLRDNDAAVEMIRVKKLGVVGKVQENGQPIYGLTDTISYFPIILGRRTVRYALVRDGNALEGRQLILLRNEVRLAGADTVSFHSFWRPLVPYLRNTTRLFFSGDGVYDQINIGLLQDKKGYLGDEIELIYLSNLREIARTENVLHPGTAVFFGEPNFALAAPTGNVRAVHNLQMEEMKGSDFSALPGTKVEIANGSAILKEHGWNTRSYTGDDALESNLKKVNDPEILHLATHGFFLEGGTNPMLRSGLIFAGVKNPGDIDGEDGILTAFEASTLFLDSTRLVILSACETGSGELRTGEGIYGLQRAFLIAGAKNIIMSLWKVDDAATQKLMTFFYQKLASGKTIREAFGIAQRTLRIEYPEPYYWGAFVLIGR